MYKEKTKPNKSQSREISCNYKLVLSFKKALLFFNSTLSEEPWPKAHLLGQNASDALDFFTELSLSSHTGTSYSLGDNLIASLGQCSLAVLKLPSTFLSYCHSYYAATSHPRASRLLSMQHLTLLCWPKINKCACLEMTPENSHTGFLCYVTPRGTIHILFCVNSAHGVHTIQMVPLELCTRSTA